MLTFALFSAAFAESPDVPVVADHTAQALDFGEFMVGTSGVHLGLLPRIQVGTQPLPLAVGFPNAAVRFQLVDHPRFDLSVDGTGLMSTLPGLDMLAVGASAQASVHIGRVSTHLTVATNQFALEGMPTASPRWISSLIGQDPLAELSSSLADANLDTAFRVNQTRLRAAVETRVSDTSSLLVQGGVAVAGNTSFRAEATVEGYTVDVGQAIPGARLADEATNPVGSWIVSLAWQVRIGRLHLRAGYGASRVPYAWAPQAFAAHLRGHAYGPERTLQGKY